MRARGIKPDLFRCDILGSLPSEIFVFYLGLGMVADRLGIFKVRPARLKVEIFPYKDDLKASDITEYLNILVEKRKLILYKIDGVEFAHMPDWFREQRPHHTEKPSGFILPPGILIPESLVPQGKDGKPLCNRDGTVTIRLIIDKDKDTDKDKDSDQSGLTSGHDQKTTDSEKLEKEKNLEKKEQEEPNNYGISIILDDGSYYTPTQDYIDSCIELYPSLDVIKEIKTLGKYKENNPEKRNHITGIAKSIAYFLAKQLKYYKELKNN